MRARAGTVFAVVGVVGMLIVCGGALRYAVQGVRADRFLTKAHAASAADDHEEAARLFEQSLAISDGNADAWADYGWELASADRPDEAVDAYDHALALEPGHRTAMCNRAYALRDAGRLEAALAGFDATAALHFHVPMVDGESAAILIELGRLDEADAALDAALARQKADADAWNRIGNLLWQRDRKDDALTAYERALAADPAHAHARFNHGLALAALGRHEEAVADFDRAIARKHRLAEAYREKSRALNQMGDAQGALDTLNASREAGGDTSEAWADTGDIHVSLGDDESALTAFRAAIEARPTHAAAHREIGEILRRRGETEEALAAFDRSIELDESPHEALIERARLRLDDLHDAEAAATDLDRAVELVPNYVHARTNRGWLRETQEDWAGALEDYSVALELDPEDVWTIGACGRMYAELGRPDEAFAAFERAIRKDPVAGAGLVHDWRRASEAARGTGQRGPDLRLVQGELNALRHLPFLKDVPHETEAPESFGNRVAESIDASTSAEQREGQKLGLRRLGLMRTPAAGEEDVDLKDAVVHALETQAAAYYDPARDTFFYVAEGMPGDMLETVAAHELVHALQDQHKNLETFLRGASRRPPGTPRNDDRVFAYRAVAEGEATFVQFAWQSMRAQWFDPEDALQANAMVVGFVSGMDTQKLLEISRQMMSKLPDDHPVKQSLAQAESIPSYVLEPFLGAYFKGAGLCNYQYSKFGWAGIDALYDRPPESAEQVLHPIRYEKKRDRPTPISLPDLGNVEAAGWTRCDAATHGELYLRLMLTENGTKPLIATRAADGWDGDVYAAYRRDDRVALVLLTTWDKERDAAQFADACGDSLLHRAGAPDDAIVTTQPLGDGVASLLPPRGPLDRSAVLVRGREVLVADGWPDELLLPVLERLERHPIDHVD